MDPIIILMTRVPHPGEAKTRMIPLLGDEGASQLQEAMCKDMGTLLKEQQQVAVFYADGNEAELERLIGSGFQTYQQYGADLGARMAHAFETVFSDGAEAAVMIGSDLPHLPADTLNQASSLLLEHEAVIGPSPDGGYYLIGFTVDGYLEELFVNQAWGTETVLASAEILLESNYRSYCLLDEFEDIDTPEDLIRLASGDMSQAPYTAAFIETVRDRLEDIGE